MRNSAVALHLPERIIEAEDGATARLAGGGIEVRDQEGRLLVRYVDGHAEISPATGDLRLRAPAGCIELEAASDVRIVAARDVEVRAERGVDTRAGAAGRSRLRMDSRGATLAAPSVDVRARRAQLAVTEATLLARSIRSSAERIATNVEELTITATRVVERSRERVMDVAERLETKAGRVRSTVRDLYSLVSRRTTLLSSDDTAIDGRRVLLG